MLGVMRLYIGSSHSAMKDQTMAVLIRQEILPLNFACGSDFLE